MVECHTSVTIVVQLCSLHKRQAIQRTQHHVLIHRHIVVAEQVDARKRTQRLLQLQVRRNAVVENAFVRKYGLFYCQPTVSWLVTCYC